MLGTLARLGIAVSVRTHKRALYLTHKVGTDILHARISTNGFLDSEHTANCATQQQNMCTSENLYAIHSKHAWFLRTSVCRSTGH